jgi:hypothetical protein
MNRPTHPGGLRSSRAVLLQHPVPAVLGNGQDVALRHPSHRWRGRADRCGGRCAACQCHVRSEFTLLQWKLKCQQSVCETGMKSHQLVAGSGRRKNKKTARPNLNVIKLECEAAKRHRQAGGHDRHAVGRHGSDEMQRHVEVRRRDHARLRRPALGELPGSGRCAGARSWPERQEDPGGRRGLCHGSLCCRDGAASSTTPRRDAPSSDDSCTQTLPFPPCSGPPAATSFGYFERRHPCQIDTANRGPQDRRIAPG